MKTLSCFTCLKEKPLLDRKNVLNCLHFKLGEVKYPTQVQRKPSTSDKINYDLIEENQNGQLFGAEDYCQVIYEDDVQSVTYTPVDDMNLNQKGEEENTDPLKGKRKHTKRKLTEQFQKNTIINWIDIKEGSFVLVKVSSVTKITTEYRYLCIVQKKDEEDGEITVQGLRVKSKNGTEYVVKGNDMFQVNMHSIIDILPYPKLIWK